MLDFTENLYKQLYSYSSSSAEELCGFILKDLSFIPVDNIAENKTETFMIDSREFLKYKKDILTIFHSHPLDRGPSPEDILACNRINIPFLICSVLESRFYYIKPKDEQCLQYDYMGT